MQDLVQQHAAQLDGLRQRLAAAESARSAPASVRMLPLSACSVQINSMLHVPICALPLLVATRCHARDPELWASLQTQP